MHMVGHIKHFFHFESALSINYTLIVTTKPRLDEFSARSTMRNM